MFMFNCALHGLGGRAVCALWHHGNSISVDGAEIDILERTNHLGFRSLLVGKDGRRLEESEFFSEKLDAPLEFFSLSKSNGSWLESFRFLDTNCEWILFDSLGCNMLSWLFVFGTLAGSLLGAGHFSSLIEIIALKNLFEEGLCHKYVFGLLYVRCQTTPLLYSLSKSFSILSILLF